MSKTIPDNLAFPVPYTLEMLGNGDFIATWMPRVPTEGLPKHLTGTSGTSGITALERLRERLIETGVVVL